MARCRLLSAALAQHRRCGPMELARFGNPPRADDVNSVAASPRPATSRLTGGSHGYLTPVEFNEAWNQQHQQRLSLALAH